MSPVLAALLADLGPEVVTLITELVRAVHGNDHAAAKRALEAVLVLQFEARQEKGT